MAGLFSLLFGTAVTISGVRHAANNVWCRQNLRKTLPNGIQYYTDADGKDRLMDGSQIVWYGYGNYEKVVKLPGHEVIYCRESHENHRVMTDIDKLNEKIKDLPLYVDVSKYYFKKDRMMIYNYGFYERESKKEIVKLEIKSGKNGPVCKKWYGYKKIYSNGYSRWEKGDEILITREEWEYLAGARNQINSIIREEGYIISLPLLLG